jgi:hypothetical protein
MPRIATHWRHGMTRGIGGALCPAGGGIPTTRQSCWRRRSASGEMDLDLGRLDGGARWGVSRWRCRRCRRSASVSGKDTAANSQTETRHGPIPHHPGSRPERLRRGLRSVTSVRGKPARDGLHQSRRRRQAGSMPADKTYLNAKPRQEISQAASSGITLGETSPDVSPRR